MREKERKKERERGGRATKSERARARARAPVDGVDGVAIGCSFGIGALQMKSALCSDDVINTARVQAFTLDDGNAH